MKHLLFSLLSATALTVGATSVKADEIADALSAASAAAETGDLKTASSHRNDARKAIFLKQGALLEALIPAEGDGLTRNVTPDFTANLQFAGGGAGVEASYYDADGNTMSLNITVDSPIVLPMLQMFGNEQMLSMMGKVVEIQGYKFLDQENGISALIDNRIYVQVTGRETVHLVKFMETMDLAKLARFDSGL